VGQPRPFLAGFAGGDAIAAILAQRQEALAPVAKNLHNLARQNVLKQSIDTLCASYVHLHLNRLSTPGSPSEQRILALLLRTRESLAKAPLTAAS